MKNLFVLLLITSGFILQSCEGNKPKDLIVNKWRITNIETPDMPLPDSIKALAMKGTMEFTKDGKWLVSGMGNDQSGTYTLSEDGKTIFVVANGKTETNEIVELTKERMVLLDKLNNSKLTVVPR